MNAIDDPRSPRSEPAGGRVPVDERLAETRAANDALLAAALRAHDDARAAASVRDQLEALMNGLAEGVIVMDGGGRLLLVNPAARQLLNLWSPQADPWQAPALVYQRLDGTPLADNESPITRAIHGDRFADLELLAVQEGGRPRRCQFSGNSVLDRNGAVAMAIVTARDVTELRQLEQLRDEYVALISHDLRSPLSLVLGAADRLVRTDGAEAHAERAELIGLIREGAERMNGMIGQLMRAASLESGQVALEREPIVLARLAAAMAEQCVPTGDGYRVEVTAGADVPPILADTALIEHALTNLLTNAAKYSQPGSPISIRVERDSDGDNVVVSVRDYGRGIPAEAQPFIFDRFFRVNEKAAGTPSGYGLGLYIVRLIVEAHGGRIWVDSQPGIGSTFTFTLPVGDLED